MTILEFKSLTESIESTLGKDFEEYGPKILALAKSTGGLNPYAERKKINKTARREALVGFTAAASSLLPWIGEKIGIYDYSNPEKAGMSLFSLGAAGTFLSQSYKDFKRGKEIEDEYTKAFKNDKKLKKFVKKLTKENPMFLEKINNELTTLINKYKSSENTKNETPESYFSPKSEIKGSVSFPLKFEMEPKYIIKLAENMLKTL